VEKISKNPENCKNFDSPGIRGKMEGFKPTGFSLFLRKKKKNKENPITHKSTPLNTPSYSRRGVWGGGVFVHCFFGFTMNENLRFLEKCLT
jgi:hypothetical protein